MDFGGLLKEYGLPGIIIFAMGCVIVYQAKDNKALIKQLFDIQEARRIEGLAVAKQLTETLSSFSQSTQQLIDKIQIVRGEK